ncbi:hypothetical protein TWF970_001365 [Orbilia oligospora]|uniref:Prion-inhibition and propagation HeLo domain-containing protein n=1 Tax=Orbilia oligospora TaxID=2813651 RepID=A0A7C8VRG6_ORBOL|nr:hypothetical protein TWF970_001365 [Orbilia oligospora]
MAEVVGGISASLHLLTVIYKYVEECKDYDQQAAELAFKLRWDAIVIKKAYNLLESVYKDKPESLSPQDKEFIEQVVSLLEPVITEAQEIGQKIQSDNWKRKWRRFTWAYEKKKFLGIQARLERWHSSLDMQLIRLPERVTTLVDLRNVDIEAEVEAALQDAKPTTVSGLETKPANGTSKDPIANHSPLEPAPLVIPTQVYNYLGAERSLRRLNKLSESHRMEVFQTLLDPKFKFEIPNTYLISSKDSAARKPLLLETWNGEPVLIEIKRFDVPSYPPLTTEDIERRIYHSIGRLAAELNSVGPETPGILHCENLDQPYIVSMEEAREDTDATTMHFFQLAPIWNVNLYRHPERQLGSKNPKAYTFYHDLYGIGVVLLELGLWRILEESESLISKYNLRNIHGESVTNALLKITDRELPVAVGTRYRRIIRACLEYDDSRAEYKNEIDLFDTETEQVDKSGTFEVQRQSKERYLDYVADILTSLKDLAATTS